MTWVFIALVAIVGGVVYVLARRRHKFEPGVTSFQRHIDALSSERRRESFDRVRPKIHDTDRDDRQGG